MSYYSSTWFVLASLAIVLATPFVINVVTMRSRRELPSKGLTVTMVAIGLVAATLGVFLFREALPGAYGELDGPTHLTLLGATIVASWGIVVPAARRPFR